MRRDVQEIFRLTPHEKQVMMFSATLSKEIRPVCRKFMQDVSLHVAIHVISVQLHVWQKHQCLSQHYVPWCALQQSKPTLKKFQGKHYLDYFCPYILLMLSHW